MRLDTSMSESEDDGLSVSSGLVQKQKQKKKKNHNNKMDKKSRSSSSSSNKQGLHSRSPKSSGLVKMQAEDVNKSRSSSSSMEGSPTSAKQGLRRTDSDSSLSSESSLEINEKKGSMEEGLQSEKKQATLGMIPEETQDPTRLRWSASESASEKELQASVDEKKQVVRSRSNSEESNTASEGEDMVRKDAGSMVKRKKIEAPKSSKKRLKTPRKGQGESGGGDLGLVFERLQAMQQAYCTHFEKMREKMNSLENDVIELERMTQEIPKTKITIERGM